MNVGPILLSCPGGTADAVFETFQKDGKHYVRFPLCRPGVDIAVTLQIVAEGGVLVCGLRSIEGRIDLKPKALRAAAIEELKKIEALAKAAGCTEMRHSGDERAWCLTDYEPMPELPHGRKKRL